MPAEVSAPHDHEPVTEPILVAGVANLSYDWSDVEVPAEPVGGNDLVADQPGEGGADEPSPEPADSHEWHAMPPAPPMRAQAIPEAGYVPPPLDFAVTRYRGQPWYRTKPAAAVLVAAVVVALAGGGWLLFRSPAAAVERTSTEAPTGAALTSSMAAPTAVSAAKPSPRPLPPPPPSPPPDSTYSPPARQYSPRYSEPTTAQKPRVDVTRAPMSVAPVPKPVLGSDSNTPGDAPHRDNGRRRRGCFGFC